MKKISFIHLMAAFCCTLAQNIEITPQTTFHDAVWGSYGTLENVNVTDNGGILYVFVKNNAALPDSIIDFKLTQGTITASLDGWRVWPMIMKAAGAGNNIATITAKSIQPPVAENEPILIEVWTKNGGYASQNFFCATPKIRLANVIPSPDMHTLYFYLRNDDLSHSFTINELMLNEETYITGSSAALHAVGDNYQVAPGKILILKLHSSLPFSQCMPLAIRVKATRSDNIIFYSGAGIRLVEPDFFFGTWHSSGLNPEKLDTRIRNRRLRYTNIHGTSHYAFMDTAYRQFFIRNTREANFGNPFNPAGAIAEVQQQSSQPYIRFWSLDDEPDLNSKPIAEQMEKNRIYWENDPNTPTYVNLAVQKKYSRYGWLPDVVSMDHYAAPDAPNIIPLTWTPIIGRKGEMREALEYTEYLKFNTEPRRMYSWCQFQANTWGNDPKEQPRDYAINYQFWAHIAGGAKGIDFFVVQDKDENDIPEQYYEALRLTRQAAAIRNLILYGEYSNQVTVNSSPSNKIVARALVGEDAVVLIVLNDNFTFTASGVLWDTAIDSVSYSIEFDMPQWLQMAQNRNIHPYRLLPDGFKAYDFHTEILAGNRIRLTPQRAIYKESHVYVIGIHDTVVPATPEGLNIPKFIDDFNYTLSWNEPHDNFGTIGYLVKFNGATVDTIYAPVFSIENDSSFNCAMGLWEIFPFDNSWNRGNPASLAINPLNPTSENIVTITKHPSSVIVQSGTMAVFTAAADNAIEYEWQMSPDRIYWQTVYSSANDSFKLYVADTSYDGKLFRVIAKTFCGINDTSDIAYLTVIPSNRGPQTNTAIKLFPNPHNGTFVVEINYTKFPISLIITDLIGKEIQKTTLCSHSEQLLYHVDMENFPNGTYLMHYVSPTSGKTIKLVKH